MGCIFIGVNVGLIVIATEADFEWYVLGLISGAISLIWCTTWTIITGKKGWAK